MGVILTNNNHSGTEKRGWATGKGRRGIRREEVKD